MPTEGQRSHGTARDAVWTYERARTREDRRYGALLRALRPPGSPMAEVERLAGLHAEADALVRRISTKYFGNLDAGEQGDWIKVNR